MVTRSSKPRFDPRVSWSVCNVHDDESRRLSRPFFPHSCFCVGVFLGTAISMDLVPPRRQGLLCPSRTSSLLDPPAAPGDSTTDAYSVRPVCRSGRVGGSVYDDSQAFRLLDGADTPQPTECATEDAFLPRSLEMVFVLKFRAKTSKKDQAILIL